MARDYAKSKGKKNYSRGRRSEGKPGWFWLFSGVLIGLAIAGFIYLKQFAGTELRRLTALQTDSRHQKDQHHQTKSVVAQNKPTVPQPRFDFYTILPKMKVSVAQQPTQQSQQKTQPQPAQNTQPKPKEKPLTQQKPTVDLPAPNFAKPKPSLKTRYALQVGSYKDAAQADRIKAQLVISGFNVHVKNVNSKGKNVSRIFVGPFISQTQAENAQKILQGQSIKSTLVKNNG